MLPNLQYKNGTDMREANHQPGAILFPVSLPGPLAIMTRLSNLHYRAWFLILPSVSR